MNFEVDRSSWAHIALCADLTWAKEPPDEFIIANQRLWAQHCRVSQVLQEATLDPQQSQCDVTDNKRLIPSQSQENGTSSGRKSVKDVIPESRLAQFYGNFYYDEIREKCYTGSNEKINRGYNGQGCENTDVTECWMLPEVEYWFRKMLDDSSDRSMFSRRRRQYRMDEDFERWGLSGARDEATLATRVSSVRGLWASAPRTPPRSPTPPPTSRKIRARRRQPKRFNALAPPPPTYCLEIPTQLFCNPACNFQFDSPRQPQLADCQRVMSQLTANVQAAIRASTSRCPPYRGTNVSRYAPTGQRSNRSQDKRYIWWPKDHPSPRLGRRFQFAQNPVVKIKTQSKEQEQNIEKSEAPKEFTPAASPSCSPRPLQDKTESLKEVTVEDDQPSTSAPADSGLQAKRLYSAVLSTSAPGLAPVVRLAQKLVTPGILKLNPKIVLPGARIRPPNVDNKFEELEKQALEQYKASDESIETKFQELEKQAEEQYSNSNSNTSCSSGNSTEKKLANSPSETESKSKPAKFHKEKPVGSVVIYSQNFPDLTTKQTSSVMNLKNFQGPPRGDKKDSHRSNKTRLRAELQRAASDTDYEARDTIVKNHLGGTRWALHAVPPKKRHLAVCASGFSSDEELERVNRSKHTGLRLKNRVGKIKMSAHGGGDLQPIARKT